MNQMEKRMKLIHGLSSATRLSVLELLKTGEKTVSQLLEKMDCSQSNLSQHLACLKECGFIQNRQSGKYVYYRLAHDDLLQLLEMIDKTVLAMGWSEDDQLECSVQLEERV